MDNLFFQTFYLYFLFFLIIVIYVNNDSDAVLILTIQSISLTLFSINIQPFLSISINSMIPCLYK
jgi:hypothetical protein